MVTMMRKKIIGIEYVLAIDNNIIYRGQVEHSVFLELQSSRMHTVQIFTGIKFVCQKTTFMPVNNYHSA